jgi:hypothetical protein
VHGASGPSTVLVLGDVTSAKRCISESDRICICIGLRWLVFRLNGLTELFLVASRATRVLYLCSNL